MNSEILSSPEHGNVYMLPEFSTFVDDEGNENPEEIARYREAVKSLSEKNKLRDYRGSKLLGPYHEGRLHFKKEGERERSTFLDPDKLRTASIVGEDFPYLKDTKLIPYAHLKSESREVESFSLFLFTKGDLEEIQGWLNFKEE